MALPTIEKTWQFNVNSPQYTTYPAIFYAIKAALVSFGSSPWVVTISSDSVTAGAGDKWLSASNVVWANAGSPHSWIVLKQTGIGSNFQVLYETVKNPGGSSSGFELYVSPSVGFSGGTTSTRPTASDEVDCTLGTLELNGFYNPATSPARVHVMQSTDGECTRWIVCTGGYQENTVIIDKAKNPVSSWTVPWVAVMGCNPYNSGVTTDYMLYSRFNDLSTRTFSRFGSVASGLYLATEGYGTAAIGETFTYPDDDTSEWPMSNIILASDTLGGRGANKGTLYDVWWGSTLPVTGDTYPGDGSKQFAQFADIILPWNGSTPLVT